MRDGRRQAKQAKLGCRSGNTSGSFCDVRGLRAFLSLSDFEFHSVTFLQALVAFGSNCAVMHKDIRSILTADESVTLGIIEPLDRTFQSFHVRPLRQSYPPSRRSQGEMKVVPAEFWAHCAAGGRGCQGGCSHIPPFIFVTLD